MGLLMDLKRRSQGAAYLWQVFQDDQRYARIALGMLEWTLLDRGIEVTERVLADAQREAAKYPDLKIGQFADGYINKGTNRVLRGM